MPYTVTVPQYPSVGARFGEAIGSGTKRRLEELALAILTGGTSLAGAQGRKQANVASQSGSPDALANALMAQSQPQFPGASVAQPAPISTQPPAQQPLSGFQKAITTLFPPGAETINKYSAIQKLQNAPLERKKLEADISLQQQLPEIYKSIYGTGSSALSQGDGGSLFGNQASIYQVGDTIERDGKQYEVVGIDSDGMPLVEPL